MSVCEVITRDGETVSERRLYTIQELKDEVHLEEYPDGIVPADVSRAYENAIEKVSEMETEWWEGETAEEQALEILADAGLSLPPKSSYQKGYQWKARPSWDISYSQGSMWFAMPESTIVDTDRFLRAMKQWASGEGWTPCDFVPGQKFTLHKSYPQVRVDFRHRHWKTIREQGLVVHECNSNFGYKATERFEDLTDNDGGGYYDPYEGVPNDVRSLCNEFLQDLCHLAMTIIRDEYEYCTSNEEHLVDTAEVNEWLFTKEGRMVR